MNKKTLYSVLFALCLIAFWLVENYYAPSTYSDPDSPGSVEVDTNFLPSSTTGEVVHHQFFSLSYNEPFEQAEWVAYELTKSQLTYDDRKRPHFIEDPKVSTKSADWKNYRGSGYDRGHLCPAGDRRFSELAYNETFYTSNISPQDKDFNAGVWNRLEQQVRRWCKKYGDLVVITGGVLEDGLREIGEEDVDVPKAFYKIVLKQNGGVPQVLAFLIPATESNVPLQRFLVSVDELEEKTGIDFFQNQPESWQEAIEQKVEFSGWKF
ncbi:DNA/RNA non-specific endonuclease [Flagellimonas sediminis]|uniref:Endonuclease n=1 Tax=Flagellimonas sediminis TaxID=2696468 RepID=A0A6I5L5U6_9FLAO|nr:DNA/RNA non-specific endonuclease [Allomuricauda sediminis]NDV44250.1 DNA/RNA non-specific endonuclease [Allomuricauda sediminis]